MHTIIAGRFEQQADSANAVQALADAGFVPDHIASFYMNPPGRHDTYPIGGDQDRSAGAEHTPAGIAAGTAAGGTVGAAVGAATAPVTGPLGAIVGAFVGAHIGNAAGALSSMDEARPGEEPPYRRSGMMVAVAVEDDDQARRAEECLRDLGAQDVERAMGTIVDGDWQDFNPVASPHFTGKDAGHGPQRR